MPAIVDLPAGCRAQESAPWMHGRWPCRPAHGPVNGVALEPRPLHQVLEPPCSMSPRSNPVSPLACLASQYSMAIIINVEGMAMMG